MAKLPKGIFGPISGKIGPVVGVVWNGVAYVRGAPRKKKKKKNGKSLAQMSNEAKFKFMNQRLVPFHPYITVGFQNVPIGKTALGTAFSINYKEAVIGVYPDFGIDYSKIRLSSGDLPGFSQPVITLIESDTIELTWQKDASPGAAFDDQLLLVLYNPELELIDGFIGGIKRGARNCRFQFDPAMIAQPLQVYVGMTSLDRKKISNSQYLGRITP